jgi:lipopolysaccharide transport system ATP-binding protein
MTNLSIRSTGLGKRYVIGRRDPYISLRDTLSGGFSFYKKPENYFWALKDIYFEIGEGEVVGIIGGNGAGKSTLLKILSRITPPTSGIVEVNGRVVSLLEVGTGFHQELTGRENIYLNGAILGMKRSEINEKFDEIVEFAEVERFLDTPVKRYSSGMYMRLAFAIAAHLESEILLVDEVLAVGDLKFQEKCLGKMKDISQKQGRTVLYVSHNMTSIRQLCKSCMLISDGKLIEKSDDISEIIGVYAQHHGAKTVKWENKERKYKNDWFEPIEVKIQGDDILISGLVKKVNPALQLGYALYDNSNNLLFWSLTTDLDSNKWPTTIKGKNVFTSRIPVEILQAGEYRLDLIVALYYQEWLVNPDNDRISVYLSLPERRIKSAYNLSRYRGNITPTNEWFSVKHEI